MQIFQEIYAQIHFILNYFWNACFKSLRKFMKFNINISSQYCFSLSWFSPEHNARFIIHAVGGRGYMCEWYISLSCLKWPNIRMPLHVHLHTRKIYVCRSALWEISPAVTDIDNFVERWIVLVICRFSDSTAMFIKMQGPLGLMKSACCRQHVSHSCTEGEADPLIQKYTAQIRKHTGLVKVMGRK